MRRSLSRRRRPTWSGSPRLAPGALFSLLFVAILMAVLLLIIVGVGADAEGQRPPALPQTHQPIHDFVAPTVAARPAAGRRRVRRAPRPVRITIPAIGVSAPIIALGLDRSGALEVPHDFGDTGWWAGGARPGERGPAVIAGHVDSYTGPAVFFRVGKLSRGDLIIVQRADGRLVHFHVQRTAHYPKAHFPSAEVYGPTGGPALRLITCSGTFDRASGHYLDNTVVYAGR
jgi:hypothetical protein